jgi:hypothetical protein
MKRFIVLVTISGSLLAQLVTLWVANIAQADTAQRKFYCGQSKNAPTTMAKTSRGPVSVIRWVSTLGETYTPESRCQIVSEKFQTYYNDGTLNYLTTGVVNQQNVICAAKVQGGSCTGVLFTLKPNSNPDQTLKRLLSIRDRTTNIVLNETAEKVYVNMNDFLESAPVETDPSPPKEIESTQGQSNTTPSSSSNSSGQGIW